jgi:hypothetical protein
MRSPCCLCVCMCIPLIVAKQRLGKHVPVKTKTHNNRTIGGAVVFYAIRAVSKESRQLVLNIHCFFCCVICALCI